MSRYARPTWSCSRLQEEVAQLKAEKLLRNPPSKGPAVDLEILHLGKHRIFSCEHCAKHSSVEASSPNHMLSCRKIAVVCKECVWERPPTSHPGGTTWSARKAIELVSSPVPCTDGATEGDENFNQKPDFNPPDKAISIDRTS